MSDNVHQNKDLKVGTTAGAFPKQEDDAKTLVLGELSSEEWSPGVDDPPLNEDSQVPDTSGVDVDDSQVLQNSQPVFSPKEEFPDSQPVEGVEENKEDPSPESPNIHDDKSVEDEGKDESAEGEEEEHATDDEVTGFLTMDDNGNLLQHGHVSDYSYQLMHFIQDIMANAASNTAASSTPTPPVQAPNPGSREERRRARNARLRKLRAKSGK